MEKETPKVWEGNLAAAELRIGIVCSRFNDFFTEKLLEGATDIFIRHGGSPGDLTIVRVPGAYELPFACSKLARSGKFDAVIPLGMVIQGATSHASQINSQVSKALAQIGLETGVPVLYGLVSAETIEQAIERSGTKAGNRGADVMMSAIEMANLDRSFLRGKKK